MATRIINDTIFLSKYLKKIDGLKFQYAGDRYPGPYLPGEGVTGSYLVDKKNKEIARIPYSDERIEMRKKYTAQYLPAIQNACDLYTQDSGKDVIIIVGE